MHFGKQFCGNRGEGMGGGEWVGGGAGVVEERDSGGVEGVDGWRRGAAGACGGRGAGAQGRRGAGAQACRGCRGAGVPGKGGYRHACRGLSCSMETAAGPPSALAS